MGFSGKKEKINGKAFIMIALLVFLVSGAWGACDEFIRYGNWADSRCNQVEWIWSTQSPSGCQQYNQSCPSSWGLCCDFVSCTGAYPVTMKWIVCSSQCEVDSVACVTSGSNWKNTGAATCGGFSCKAGCSDSTWYNCESVFTENNVVRSQITEYDCDSVVATRQVIGGCSENGFCEGDALPGADSCSNVLDSSKCRFGGQNGSLCTYVCADGKIHSCTIHWEPGQPAEYQNCPNKPYQSCINPNSSSSGRPSSVDSLPDLPGPGSSSSSGGGDEPPEDCPECDYLQEIRDTLHRANEQRRFANYLLDSIKQDVGGFGAQFNSIVSNTNLTQSKLNTSNSYLSSISTTNSQIVNKLNSLDLDNITATVDSVVVHVDMPRDTVPWYFTADLDSLPVWRDTISETNRLIRDINSQVDTLVQDSAGDNILKKFLPYVKKTFDKIEDFYSGYTLPAMLDSLSGRLGLDTLTVQEEAEVSDRVTRLSDSTYIEGNWYCEEHPDDEVCVELDSAQLQTLLPFDTVDANEFFRVQDSILEYNRAVLDSMRKRDSTPDTLGLQELAGDSAKIRDKLGFLFFPNETLEQCFEFRMNSRLNGWAVNLVIDFANVFGWDLCDLIRKIVRLITFILIVFTTIKGYIRAFGGGGPGGG